MSLNLYLYQYFEIITIYEINYVINCHQDNKRLTKTGIEMYINNPRKLLNMMLPLKFKLDRKTWEIIYVSFIRPVMEYGNVVWGGTYDSDICKLEQIQIENYD